MLSSHTPSRDGAAELVRVELGYLTPDNARRLFLICYGLAPDQLLAEDDEAAVAAIVEALGYFPLAVSLYANQAQKLGSALQPLAAQLQEQPLDAIDDERVRKVYERSLSNLAQQHQDVETLLIAWSAFGAPTIGRRALEAMARDMGVDDPVKALTTMRTWLLAGPVEPATLPPGSDTERWQAHRLMFDYLTKRFDAWPPEKRRQAQTSAMKYLAEYMKTAPERAIAIDERAVMKSLDFALSARSDEADYYATLLGVPIAHFWRSRWVNTRSLDYLPSLIEAAKRVTSRAKTRDNLLRQADLNLLRGRAIRYAGHLPEAERYFQRDLKIRRHKETRDRKGEAEALYHLGQLYRIEGHMRAAERYCVLSLTRASLEHDEKLTGLVIGELGRIARIRGRTAEAQRHFERAFKLLSELGNLQEAAVMLGYLGRIARLRGQFQLAKQYFEESMRLAQVSHDARGQGVVLSYQGRIKRTQGQLTEAKSLFDRSLQAAREAGDTATEATVLGYQGRLLYTDGQFELARQKLMESYHLSRSTLDGQNVAMVLGYIGRIRRAQGHGLRAISRRLQGLAMVYRVGDKRGQALSYRQLARFALQLRLLWLASHLARRAELNLFHLEDRRGVVITALLQAEITVARGYFDAARRRFDFCQTIFEQMDDKVNACGCVYWKARIADAEGVAATADTLFEQALTIATNIGDGDAGLIAKITHYQGVSMRRRPAMRAEGKAVVRRAREMYQAMGAKRPPEPMGRRRRWPRRV
jgi:tetratricopeptide (TPR) repeat protein